MQITEVTVSWTETANLGNYSNVRPSLSLKATIDPQEFGAVHIYNELMVQCKSYVQEQVDQALEAEGQPAKYSTEPRFDVLVESWGNRMVLVIVPCGIRLQFDGGRSYPAAAKFRLASAHAYARQRAKEVDRGEVVVEIYDASSDDMAIEDALLAMNTAKAAYDADQAEKRRQQEEDWEAEKQRRIAERERERERTQRAPLATERDPFAGDEEDDESDDEE